MDFMVSRFGLFYRHRMFSQLHTPPETSSWGITRNGFFPLPPQLERGLGLTVSEQCRPELNLLAHLFLTVKWVSSGSLDLSSSSRDAPLMIRRRHQQHDLGQHTYVRTVHIRGLDLVPLQGFGVDICALFRVRTLLGLSRGVCLETVQNIRAMPL